LPAAGTPTTQEETRHPKAPVRQEIKSPFRLAFMKLRRNRMAMAALVVVLAEILVAAGAPLFTTYDPVEINPPHALQAPSKAHIMGTDQFGRDIWTRILFGARISLQVGVVSVTIATIIGVPLGLIAGYYGGPVDAAVVRAMDLMLAFPGILLALAIVTILGPSLANSMIAVGISAIPLRVRLVRGSVLSTKENAYVEAARALGCSVTTIMFRHILPNIVSPLIVLTSLSIANAILTAASLSFLGLGAQPPVPEWGAMLGGGRAYMGVAWWMTTFPGVAIMITVLAMNILGDGLRDAFDPKLTE
jgi:peptide/nickel transport system permease protein